MEHTTAVRPINRPHYKSLYTTAVSLNKRQREELEETKRRLDVARQSYDYAESERTRTFHKLNATDDKLFNWQVVAVIEALALFSVAILLVAR